LTQRVEKDFYSRRSWIGGEGISSRDQYRSGTRENRGNRKCVSTKWSRNNKVTLYELCHTTFVHVYTGFSGDKRIYAGLIKESHVHLKKRENLGLYCRPRVARVCRCSLKLYYKNRQNRNLIKQMLNRQKIVGKIGRFFSKKITFFWGKSRVEGNESPC
jgi:hypothetical protein